MLMLLEKLLLDQSADRSQKEIQTWRNSLLGKLYQHISKERCRLIIFFIMCLVHTEIQDCPVKKIYKERISHTESKGESEYKRNDNINENMNVSDGNSIAYPPSLELSHANCFEETERRPTDKLNSTHHQVSSTNITDRVKYIHLRSNERNNRTS